MDASNPEATADADLPQGLSDREIIAVEALLQQPTIARAALSVRMHERTLRRWMHVPHFRAALLEARRASFSQAIGLTQMYSSVAVATLVKVMNDPAAPAHCRVSAAAALLRFGREGLELEDLADRVHALERVVVLNLPCITATARDADDDNDESADAGAGQEEL